MGLLLVLLRKAGLYGGGGVALEPGGTTPPPPPPLPFDGDGDGGGIIRLDCIIGACGV